MAETKKSAEEWIAYLGSAGRDLTLAEMMTLLLWNIYGASNNTAALAQDQRDGVTHMEAMLGTFDEAMAATNPDYRALADRRADEKREPKAKELTSTVAACETDPGE